MSKEELFIILQKEGLKFHFSYNKYGNPSLCGKTRFVGKSVMSGYLNFFDSESMCEKCLDIAEYNKDGQPKEEY